MHKAAISARLSLALSLLILIHPALHVQAAGPPIDAETLPTSTAEPPSTNPATGYYYTVQTTDTLWDIAVAHGITVETLIAANELPDPRHLLAGQKVFVPALPAVVPRKPAPIAPVAESTPIPAVTAAPTQPAPASADAPVAAPTPEPAPAAPPPPETAAAPEPGGWQAEILGLINAKRTAQGLRALTWSPALARAAQAHAADCAQRNKGSHFGSDGANLSARLARITQTLGFVSRHSWGEPIDMNTSTNVQGGTPHMDCRGVRIFRKHNFAWGGNFLTPDGMHFEWVGEPRNTLQYPSRYCPNTVNGGIQGIGLAGVTPTQRDTLFAGDGLTDE